MPVETAVKLSFFGGACAILTIVLIVILFAQKDDSKFLTEVSHGISIYYILFWFFLVILGSALSV